MNHIVREPRNRVGTWTGAVGILWTFGFLFAGLGTEDGATLSGFEAAIALPAVFGAVILWVVASKLGIKHAHENPRHMEHVAKCSVPFGGSILIGFAGIFGGTGIVFLVYGNPDAWPMWNLVLLFGNTAVMMVGWWLHLALDERPFPQVPPSDKKSAVQMFDRWVTLEAEFDRAIIGTVTQMMYLVGIALLGVGAILLNDSGVLELSVVIFVLLGLGVWVLMLHLMVTAPFMTRYHRLIEAYQVAESRLR